MEILKMFVLLSSRDFSWNVWKIDHGQNVWIQILYRNVNASDQNPKISSSYSLAFQSYFCCVVRVRFSNFCPWRYAVLCSSRTRVCRPIRWNITNAEKRRRREHHNYRSNDIRCGTRRQYRYREFFIFLFWRWLYAKGEDDRLSFQGDKRGAQEQNGVITRGARLEMLYNNIIIIPRTRLRFPRSTIFCIPTQENTLLFKTQWPPRLYNFNDSGT